VVTALVERLEQELVGSSKSEDAKKESMSDLAVDALLSRDKREELAKLVQGTEGKVAELLLRMVFTLQD